MSFFNCKFLQLFRMRSFEYIAATKIEVSHYLGTYISDSHRSRLMKDSISIIKHNFLNRFFILMRLIDFSGKISR